MNYSNNLSEKSKARALPHTLSRIKSIYMKILNIEIETKNKILPDFGVGKAFLTRQRAQKP